MHDLIEARVDQDVEGVEGVSQLTQLFTVMLCYLLERAFLIHSTALPPPLVDLLPLLLYQLPIECLEDPLDLLIPLLTHPDQLHIVLLQVFCHALRILKGR